MDDNDDIRSLLAHALAVEGFDVVEAENGLVARERLLQSELPSVILLDLMMPVMDGKEFLDWKLQHSVYSQIPVIVVSAMVANKALPGTVGYLRKPIDLTELFELLSHHVHTKDRDER